MEMLVPWKRKVKNVVCQYNETQIKVRDATSNDPCNPALGVLIELADLSKRSYELVSIMQVIWKRLNDRGNNWRHCYKSLYVLEYLIKMGDPQVYQQCKQNFRALQLLAQFQFVDECGKDVGINVRQKAIQVLELLTNDAKLEEEREKELKNREKHEKMQQQVRQQQLQQQQQHQMALNSKSMPVVPKGNDTYVHRLDRSSALHTSSGGYDDPYGGATGDSYPNAYDYGQASSYDAQYGNQNNQYAIPNANVQYDQYAYSQQQYAQNSAISNPFQALDQNAMEQQKPQQDAVMNFGQSPADVQQQRITTNPFLCDFEEEPAPIPSSDGFSQPTATATAEPDLFAGFDPASLNTQLQAAEQPPLALADAANGSSSETPADINSASDQLSNELRDLSLRNEAAGQPAATEETSAAVVKPPEQPDQSVEPHPDPEPASEEPTTTAKPESAVDPASNAGDDETQPDAAAGQLL